MNIHDPFVAEELYDRLAHRIAMIMENRYKKRSFQEKLSVYDIALNSVLVALPEIIERVKAENENNDRP